MTQMNNEDIEKLYSIASHLKVANDSMMSYEELLKKNPSHTTRERYVAAFTEYEKALSDFNYFLENFIVFSNNEKEKEDS